MNPSTHFDKTFTRSALPGVRARMAAFVHLVVLLAMVLGADASPFVYVETAGANGGTITQPAEAGFNTISGTSESVFTSDPFLNPGRNDTYTFSSSVTISRIDVEVLSVTRPPAGTSASISVTGGGTGQVALPAIGTYSFVPTISNPEAIRLSVFSGTGTVGTEFSSVTYKITIVGTGTPAPASIQVPGNMVFAATSPAGAVVSFNVSGFDNNGVPVTTVAVPASGSVFPLGATTVNVTATDDLGNPLAASFMVTVVNGANAVFNESELPGQDFGDDGASPTRISQLMEPGVYTITGNNHGEALDIHEDFIKIVTRYPIVKVEAVISELPDLPAQFPGGGVQRYNTAEVAVVSGGSGKLGFIANGTYSFVPVITTPQAVVLKMDSIFWVQRIPHSYTLRITTGGTPYASGLFTDDPAPTLALPANITAEASRDLGAVVNFTVGATDSGGFPRPVTVNPPSGSVFPLGTTTVNVSTDNPNGGTVTGTFTVSVVDTTPPVLTLPDDISVVTTSTSGKVVIFALSAVDTVSAVQTIASHVSGSLFPVGTTTVEVSATDAANNTAQGSFTVTVLGNEPAQAREQSTGWEFAGAEGERFVHAEFLSSRIVSVTAILGNQRFVKVARMAGDSASVSLNRAGQPALVLSLATELNVAREPVVVADINGDSFVLRRGLYRRKAPAPGTIAGHYTFVIPGADFVASTGIAPAGDGVGTLEIRGDGSVQIVGRLGDHTAFAANSILTQGNHIPFGSMLYGTGASRGFITGSLTLDLANPDTDLSGAIVWSKPPQTRGAYAAGFEVEGTVEGSRFAVPVRSLPLPFTGTSKAVTLATDFAAIPYFATGNMVAGPRHFTLSGPGMRINAMLNSRTGYLSGVRLGPAGPRAVHAVILQKAGTFRGMALSPQGDATAPATIHAVP